MRNGVPHRGTQPLGSVTNAVEALKAFGRKGEWGVSELARELDLSKSVTHRLLQTLANGGFVEQSAERGTYTLGMEMLRIARAAARRTTLGAVAHRHLERLAQQSEEAAYLTVLRGQRYVCVDIVDLAHHVKSVVQLGDTLGLHAGAGGKAMLAYQPRIFREEVARGPLVRYTERTICDPAELEAELETVRRDGYAVSDSEVTPGTGCVAAPIHDHEGRVIATVNVTTPGTRVGELDRYVDLVREAARGISEELGYVRPVQRAAVKE